MSLYDYLEASNHTILSFFYIHGLIQFRYYGLLIFPCSLTTRLECIAATFIRIVYQLDVAGVFFTQSTYFNQVYIGYAVTIR